MDGQKGAQDKKEKKAFYYIDKEERRLKSTHTSIGLFVQLMMIDEKIYSSRYSNGSGGDGSGKSSSLVGPPARKIKE